MPKSKVSKKRMFRDFSKLKEKYVNNNFLKNLHSSRKEFCDHHEIDWKHLEFLLWAYDLEFFTIKYAAEEYGYNHNNLANRIIYPLQSEDLLYKHFERLTPSQSLDDHLFRSETKYNYRVRYALTQRARLLVQRFYQSL
tara:strand:- start:461 stop:877 length:417 start_codon:yes stop_codon:yes gene_type:complete